MLSIPFLTTSTFLQEVIEELDRLKNSPQGWKLCGDGLVKKLYR